MFFYFLVPNGFVLLSLLEIPLLSAWKPNLYYSWLEECCRKLCLILVVLFPIWYLYIWYRILYSERFWFIPQILAYEICLIFAGAIVYILWKAAYKIIPFLVSIIILWINKVKSLFAKKLHHKLVSKHQKRRKGIKKISNSCQ